ncbi:BlaI/MecI/CopY family transcriptional regulator [Caulobacter hibisci]|uniref:BlaI/MecI/CopY family transcriptional regulator n=1 Tax=Caulobacter hibisci TaxID=2035993 RepID=A0ABS0T314_9CAUL|nr:BlaI/MecI/CopY family transcriptional regulator [Caulobacter hibisci]MBI1685876.1 BlaI/MecI/CopY family transcriptional regulator [Caulobacter hibisci]
MGDPSELELEVMKAFWRRGAMSVREVQAAIADPLGWSASTTRTVLERMVAKDLLDRDAVHGLAVYRPRKAKVAVIGGVLKRLRGLLDIDGPLPASAFSGSQLLDSAELAELEALLAAKDEEENRP